MDTDDLSTELYKAIFNPAEKYNHDLTLHFGLLASDCENERDYISKAEKLIEVLKISGIGFFFENKPPTARLIKVLDKIQENIEKVKQIPIEKRIYEF